MPGGRSEAVRDDVYPRVLPSKVLELGTGVPRMSLESGRKWGSGGPRGLRDAIKVGAPCVAQMNLWQRKGIEEVDLALLVRQENGYAVSGEGLGQPEIGRAAWRARSARRRLSGRRTTRED